MGTPNDVSISIVFAADYRPAGKGVALWDYDGCLNVLVPRFRSDFLLKREKDLVCLLVIQVRLYVRGVYESNCLKLSSGKVSSSPFFSRP